MIQNQIIKSEVLIRLIIFNEERQRPLKMFKNKVPNILVSFLKHQSWIWAGNVEHCK